MKVEVITTVGQKLMSEQIVNQSRKTLNLGELANGIYFVVVTDEKGNSSVERITLSK